MALNVTYRGLLSSCNYSCFYCPLELTSPTKEELRRDRKGLDRFVRWVSEFDREDLEILIAPRGEALIWPWYREALIQLSHSDQVRAVAIQTNLSCPIDWTSECDGTSFSLWCSYHPDQLARRDFVNKCRVLDGFGVKYSVGVVGLTEHIKEIKRLKSELSPEVYLWINAYKRDRKDLPSEETEFFESIDPLYSLNTKKYPSLGQPCFSGQSSIAVDGKGEVYPCLFVNDRLGNIEDGSWESNLGPRLCPNEDCWCHIGYIHLKALGLRDFFGDGFVSRRAKPGINVDEARRRSRILPCE